MNNVYQKQYRQKLDTNVAKCDVIKITTPHEPRLTQIENILRESVQLAVGRLKLQICRCFKNINLILLYGEHMLHIMYIIKSQTERGVIVIP